MGRLNVRIAKRPANRYDLAVAMLEVAKKILELRIEIEKNKTRPFGAVVGPGPVAAPFGYAQAKNL